MKKSIYALLVVVLIVAVYSGFWWKQAEDLKDTAADTLAALSHDSREHELTYDNIQKGGYPFAFEITLTNPKISTKQGEVIIAKQGTFTIGSSIFDRHHIWIKSSGVTTVSPPDSKPLVIQGNLEFECGNCGRGIPLLGQMHTSRSHREIIFTKLLQDSSYSIHDFSISQPDDASGKTLNLLSVKEALLKIHSKQVEEHHDFNLTLDVEKANTGLHQLTFPRLDTISAGLDINNEQFQEILNRLGTYDGKLQIHGSIPDIAHPFFQQPSLNTAPSFSFVLDHFEYKSEFEQTSNIGELSFENKPDGHFKGILKSDKKTIFYDTFKTFLVDTIKIGCNAYSKSKKATEKQQELCSIIIQKSNSLIPDFAALSPFESIFDLSVSGERGKLTYDIRNINIDLKDFKLAAKGYSFEMIAQIEGDLQQSFTGLVEFKIENYVKLINKLSNYYNRWQKVMVDTKYVKAKDLPPFNDKTKDLILNLLKSLSVGSKDNLDIPIKVAKGNQITVGNKSQEEAQEIIAQFEQDFKKATEPKEKDQNDKS